MWDMKPLALLEGHPDGRKTQALWGAGKEGASNTVAMIPILSQCVSGELTDFPLFCWDKSTITNNSFFIRDSFVFLFVCLETVPLGQKQRVLVNIVSVLILGRVALVREVPNPTFPIRVSQGPLFLHLGLHLCPGSSMGP